MLIHGAYTLGIDAHLFAVSARPNQAGRIRITGLPDTIAAHAADIVTATLRHLNPTAACTDLHAEPAGPEDPPLGTARHVRDIELPMTLAALVAHGQLPAGSLSTAVAIGGLDAYRPAGGRIPCLPARGVTAVAETVQRRGLRLLTPWDDAGAAMTECSRTTGAHTLEELVDVITGRAEAPAPLPARSPKRRQLRMWGVGGDELRAIEIACAGSHNISILSPADASHPRYGSLAQAVLPDLQGNASRETTRIHAVAGLTAPGTARLSEPPLRIPHYTASCGAIAGTRDGAGEVNLAHNGLLVVDQPTEFDRRTLAAVVEAAKERESLRLRMTPVEHTIRIPADFLLMVTSRADEIARRRHRAAPVLDLCAIEITVPCPGRGDPLDPDTIEESRSRIACARHRLERHPPPLPGPTADPSTTGRRTRAVAQTIAALAHADTVDKRHLDEAQDLVNRTEPAS